MSEDMVDCMNWGEGLVGEGFQLASSESRPGILLSFLQFPTTKVIWPQMSIGVQVEKTYAGYE